ncbi:prepilin peptidase [Actibacterium mucosum]|nr:prepilin peptidase [Actibacterium mucosum]
MSLLWAVFSTVLSALLALAAVIDHQTGRIPDVVPAVLALTGAAMLFLTGAQWLPFVVTSAAIVALLVTVRARNRPIPIGEGDLLLIAAAGMWLGPIHLAWAILVSTAAHLLGLLVQRFAGGPSPTLAPFAPAMFFGIFCVWALSR